MKPIINYSTYLRIKSEIYFIFGPAAGSQIRRRQVQQSFIKMTIWRENEKRKRANEIDYTKKKQWWIEIKLSKYEEVIDDNGTK